MPTDKPKLQGYVEHDLAERFTQWKQEKGIDKDSAALNELLKQFFGVPSPQVPAPLPDESDIRQIVELLLEEKLPSREALADEMKKAIAQIEARLEALESSNPSSNPPDDLELLTEIADNLQSLEQRLEALENANSGECDHNGEISSVERESGLPETANVPESSGDRLEQPEEHAATDRLLKPCVQGILEEVFREDQEKHEQSNGRLPSESLSSLSGTELAKRLRIDKSLITKNRVKETFQQWTASKDPQGLAWHYVEDTKRYEPIM